MTWRDEKQKEECLRQVDYLQRLGDIRKGELAKQKKMLDGHYYSMVR